MALLLWDQINIVVLVHFTFYLAYLRFVEREKNSERIGKKALFLQTLKILFNTYNYSIAKLFLSNIPYDFSFQLG